MASEIKKIPLYGYQRKLMQEYRHERFLIWNKSRQIGVSWGFALAILMDILETGSRWTLLSASERQSKELMETLQSHAEVMQVMGKYLNYAEIFEDSEFLVEEARFKNGGRAICLPANPKTVRGFSGNLFLDEFAHHQNPEKIFAAAAPIATRKGNKIWMASTPYGDSGKFHDIFVKNPLFRKLQTDIYQAKNDGCPVDPEELKILIDDPFIWDTEYLCQFLSAANAYISSELMSKCEEQRWPLTLPETDLIALAKEGDLFAGFDVGRKRNKSSFWLLVRTNGRKEVRHIVRLEKMEFRKQKEFLKGMLFSLPIRRLSIDATGIGMNLAEDLKLLFGARIEPVTFTQKSKEPLATRLKEAMEDGLWRMPHDPDIRYDFNSIRQIVTPTGNFRYDAEQNEKGHADDFWAAALANEAASSPVGTGHVDHVSKSMWRGNREHL